MSSIKAVLAAFVLFSALPVAASAGDIAESTELGFSPDGRYFAFEEYGVQDGSGFPFANIFLIETATDRWVKGTPIRVRIDNEETSLTAARAEAMRQAASFLDARQIGVQGTTVVSNPLTETSADPYRATFLPTVPYLPRPSADYTLTLEPVDLPAPDCPDMGQPYRGMRLILGTPEGDSRYLVDDKSIPKSRRCPFNYGISDVVLYHPPGGQTVFAIFVNVFPLGFEGPDRRFIVVTGLLN